MACCIRPTCGLIHADKKNKKIRPTWGKNTYFHNLILFVGL